MHLKYFDQGYYTLPIRPGSKATALKSGYSLYEWATSGIPYETIELWDKEFPLEKGFGIAVLCGKASGIIAVDMDTDDERVHAIIPDSPCEKIGARPTRFFRYSDAFASKINIGKNHTGLKDHVEILTTGQYCILPPSMHPDTKKQYFWSTEDNLLWFTPDDLPELPQGVIRELGEYYDKKYGETSGVANGDNLSAVVKPLDMSEVFLSDSDRCPHGSHDRLKQLAATMIRRGEPLTDAVRALYNYDKEHHRPLGYFWDKSRGADCKADPETNAIRFYTKQLEFINRKRLLEGEEPHSVIGEDIIIDFGGGDTLTVDVQKLVPYPKARGLMGQMQDYVQLLAPFHQDALSLGGALSMMSILAANKFRTQIGHFDVRPNLYILNLGKSGAGKETVQSLNIDLLSGTSLIGSSGYKSGTSIIKGLPKQQERINIMDEAAAWLKSVADGEGFQQEMNDILSGLFTRVSGFYPGISLASEDGDKLGACWNPHLTLLASTTLHGFKNAVNQSMGAKGLLPRFVTFWQHSLGKYQRPSRQAQLKAAELRKQIEHQVQRFLKIEKRLHPSFNPLDIDLSDGGGEQNDFGKRYDPELITMSDEAEERYFNYAEEKAPKDTLFDSYDEPFLNRHAELAGKIALLDTLSRGEAEITLESLEWAISVVEAQWANMKSIFKETSAENLTEKTQIRVLEMIKTEGGIIGKSDLARKTQWLNKQVRAQVVDGLVEAGFIEVVQVPNPGGRGNATHVTSYRVTA